MKLDALGADYLDDADRLKARAMELRKRYQRNAGQEVNQRIALLERMARETREIGCHLRDYYKR